MKSKLFTKRNIINIIFTMIISFLIGFLISNTYNYFNSKYICNFSCPEQIQIEEILTKDRLEETKNSADKYKNINTDSLLNENGIYILQNDETYQIETYSRYYDTFFLKDKQMVSTRAKTFIKDLLLNYNKDIKFQDPDNIIKETNNLNNYYIGLFSMVIITLTIGSFITIKSLKKNNLQEKLDTFSIFSLNYWKQASSFLSDPKKISSLAMIFALLLISKTIKIPSGFSNLGLGLGFIFFSIIGVIFGPISGLLIGFLSDVLGYFLFDTSGTAFFIGYVFQAMISGFIHGLILYKKEPTFFRILFLRIMISLICNVIIGSICWGIVANYTFEQTLSYMIVFIIPKNIIYLIPQSVVLYFILKSLSPLFIKKGFIITKE